MKGALLAWFYGLQPRERWLVAIGAALFVVIVGWGFILKPLNADVARLQESVQTKQRLLVDVARVEVERPQTVADGRQGNDRALVQLIPDTARMAVNYGLDRVRFLAPVKSGKRVRGHFTLEGADEKAPGQLLLKHQVTVEIEGEDKPALTAQWLGLIFT